MENRATGDEKAVEEEHSKSMSVIEDAQDGLGLLV